MVKNRKFWNGMVEGCQDPGYVGINLPIEFKPKANKGRNVAHDIRRGAILETMHEMGQENFLRAIDHKIKSGDRIEWEEPLGDGTAQIPMDEPEFETQLDTFAKLDLPPEIEAAVRHHMETIAISTRGRHL
eukprot:2161479-Amphidinium_carterae.5